jgi:hypothetical protein
MGRLPDKAYDTVLADTPAWRATSEIVAIVAPEFEPVRRTYLLEGKKCKSKRFEECGFLTRRPKGMT